MIKHRLVDRAFPIDFVGKHFFAQNHGRPVLCSRQLPYLALLQYSSVHAAVQVVVKHDLIQLVVHQKADMKPT